MVYRLMVLAFMVVLPIISIAIEFAIRPDPATIVPLIGKWFVFWSVGVRLFTAGLSQVLRPGFTTKLLGIDAPKAEQVVQELGFANVGIGLAGLIAPWVAGWTTPVAIVAGVFLVLAAVRHLVKRDRSATETFTTWTDLFAGVVLLGVAIAAPVTLVLA